MELRVKEICREKNVLMKDLADTLGINRVSLTSMINGNPTIQTLEKIASALGVEVIELFEPKRGDFTALVDNNVTLRRFDSIETLNAYISQIIGKV